MAEGWRIDAFVVLEKILESSVDYREIKPVSPKENKPWIFTVKIDAKALILWPPDVTNWLNGKDPNNGGKDWGQEEKGVADEMIR